MRNDLFAMILRAAPLASLFSPGCIVCGRSALALGRIAAVIVFSIGVAIASGEERTQSIGPVTFHVPAQPLIDGSSDVRG